jgi:hypothetical protein
MPRGWGSKSAISTWVNVSKDPARPKWKEMEEDPGPSTSSQSKIPPPSLFQTMVDGPGDGDGGNWNSHTSDPFDKGNTKGKVKMYTGLQELHLNIRNRNKRIICGSGYIKKGAYTSAV